MTDESLLQFITRRMYEIEASGASEYLTGQIVAYDEIKRKVLEIGKEIESKEHQFAAEEDINLVNNNQDARFYAAGSRDAFSMTHKLIGESK